MNIPYELIVAALTGIMGLAKMFRFVHEGELGLKLRFGKVVRDRDDNPLIIEPGFVFLIPFVDSLHRHHVRQQTLELGEQQVMISNGLVFKVNATVMYRVIDIYQALFEIDDLDDSIDDLAQGVLREVLSGKSHEELFDIAVLSQELFKLLEQKAVEWGIELIQFNLIDCAPTPETASLVSVGTGIKLRVMALQNAAETLGIQLQNLDPVLAAALIGVPVVSSITSTPVSIFGREDKKES